MSTYKGYGIARNPNAPAWTPFEITFKGKHVAWRATEQRAQWSIDFLIKRAGEKADPQIGELQRAADQEPKAPKAPRAAAVSTADKKTLAKIAKAFAGAVGQGTCFAIRAATIANPEATAEDMVAALPDLNPSTVRIQYRKAKS